MADSHNGTYEQRRICCVSIQLRPHPAEQTEGAVDPGGLPAPVERERVDARRSSAPVQRLKLPALVVRSIREYVHRVWPETLLRFAEERETQHRVVRDEQLGKLIRKGILLPWHPLNVESDPVLQSEPEKLPR